MSQLDCLILDHLHYVLDHPHPDMMNDSSAVIWRKIWRSWITNLFKNINNTNKREITMYAKRWTGATIQTREIGEGSSQSRGFISTWTGVNTVSRVSTVDCRMGLDYSEGPKSKKLVVQQLFIMKNGKRQKFRDTIILSLFRRINLLHQLRL